MGTNRRRFGALLVVIVVGWVCLSQQASTQNRGDPKRSEQYALDMIKLSAAANTARGAGVMVAVVDSGVHLGHQDLVDNLLEGRDFVNPGEEPQDKNGHGTHVAGVIAAVAGNGIGIEGIAPRAKILPVRVLNEHGAGLESNVAAGIDHALTTAREADMKLVINLSLVDANLNQGADTTILTGTMRRAWDAGAVVVAASGNDALEFSDFVDTGANVLVVGATSADLTVQTFSNKGVSLVAPGDNIVSTIFDPENPLRTDVYGAGTGTSQASPHVAGAAAILLSEGHNNAQTVRRILAGSDDVGEPGFDESSGWGFLNIERSLGDESQLRVLIDPNAKPPRAPFPVVPLAVAAVIVSAIGLLMLAKKRRDEFSRYA